MIDDIRIELESEIEERSKKTEPTRPRKLSALQTAQTELRIAHSLPSGLNDTARELWHDYHDDIIAHYQEQLSRKQRREILGFDCNAEAWEELRLIAQYGYDEAERMIREGREAQIVHAISDLIEAYNLPDDDPDIVAAYHEWSDRLNIALYKLMQEVDGDC